MDKNETPITTCVIAGEDEVEERLEEEDPDELDEPLELDELDELLRSLLRRHCDSVPLIRKGQSLCLSEAETSAVVLFVATAAASFRPVLTVPLSSAKKSNKYS